MGAHLPTGRRQDGAVDAAADADANADYSEYGLVDGHKYGLRRLWRVMAAVQHALVLMHADRHAPATCRSSSRLHLAAAGRVPESCM